jgi:hypothetical protein
VATDRKSANVATNKEARINKTFIFAVLQSFVPKICGPQTSKNAKKKNRTEKLKNFLGEEKRMSIESVKCVVVGDGAVGKTV